MMKSSMEWCVEHGWIATKRACDWVDAIQQDAIKSSEPKVCEWTKNKIGNLATTGCKGTTAPVHSDTDFCHRCGGKVVVT